MTKSDESRPEPVLFLMAADDAMKEFHKQRGEYASQWEQLDISFARGPYRTTDAGVRPTPQQGNSWRPKDCEFTYVIARADRQDYLIQAFNQGGAIEYEMQPNFAVPNKVLMLPEDELCNAEQPRGKTIPEPARFLNAAAAEFDAFRQQYLEYPRAWEQLDFHWAMVPHKASDKDVRPPPRSGTFWQPRGSDYIYEIVRSNQNSYLLRSRNQRGLPDYQLRSGDTSPTLVQ